MLRANLDWLLVINNAQDKLKIKKCDKIFFCYCLVIVFLFLWGRQPLSSMVTVGKLLCNLVAWSEVMALPLKLANSLPTFFQHNVVSLFHGILPTETPNCQSSPLPKQYHKINCLKKTWCGAYSKYLYIRDHRNTLYRMIIYMEL